MFAYVCLLLPTYASEQLPKERLIDSYGTALRSGAPMLGQPPSASLLVTGRSRETRPESCCKVVWDALEPQTNNAQVDEERAVFTADSGNGTEAAIYVRE